MGNWGSVPLGDPRNLSQLSHWSRKEGCPGAVLPSTCNLPHPPLQPGTVVQLGSLWSVSLEAVRAEGTEHASRKERRSRTMEAQAELCPPWPPSAALACTWLPLPPQLPVGGHCWTAGCPGQSEHFGHCCAERLGSGKSHPRLSKAPKVMLLKSQGH